LNRVYVKVPAGPLHIAPWLTALKQGRTFATNGPLLDFTLGGKQLGDELKLPAGSREVKFTASLRSIVPINHLEVVCNGKVARDLNIRDSEGEPSRGAAEIRGTVPISETGWCVLRAWSDKAEYPVLDAYPYATTSPVYVTVEGSSPHHTEDGAYFIAWIDRLAEAAKANRDWNTDAEKQTVLDLLSQARKVYERLQK
jgi:hypothetical protein